MAKQPERFTHIAFLSYRSSDAKLASWLHRKLETYKVPRSLVGQIGEFGHVPRRLGRIFRDREEARTAEDIETVITNELSNSEHLIVLCTPLAAASQSWVGREIEIFRQQRPDGVVHAVIGDGEPPDCFPSPLLMADSSGRLQQPLAADLRPVSNGGQDGCEKAVVKIIAGLLGVRFDDLWQREKRRRLARFALGSVTALLTIAIAGGGVFTAQQSSLADRYMAISDQAVTAHHWDTAALAAASSAKASRWIGLLYPGDARERLLQLRGEGRTSALLAGHSKMVYGVVVDRKSGAIFTASRDRRIHIWQQKAGGVSGRVLYRMPPGLTSGIRFSQRRRLLAAFSGNNIAVFDSDSATVKSEIRLNDKIKAIEFADSDETIAVATADGGMVLMVGHDFSSRRVIYKSEAGLEVLAVSPNGFRIAFGDEKGNVWLHFIDGDVTKQIRKADPAHEAAISHIAFGKDVLIVSSDDFAETFNTTNGAPGKYFTIDDLTVDETHLDASKKIAVSLLSGFRLKSWDIKTGNFLANFIPADCEGSDAYTCNATKVVFAPSLTGGEDYILAGYLNGTIRMWTTAGELIGDLRGHVGPISALAVSDDGKQLYSASEDRSARVWSLGKVENGENVIGLFCKETLPELLNYDSAFIKKNPLRFNVAVDRSQINSQALLASLDSIRNRGECE